MKRLITILYVTITFNMVYGQDAPNYANSSMSSPSGAQADKMNANPVNLFTGIPNISVPIYSFKNNSGISTSVSLEYSGGGVQVAESPSILGLSWYLNAGGMITRVVRGLPDDVPTYGYMYASQIPADWRTNERKYYSDSIDAQQDIFQFNFPGHSGKFFIGKNGQIVTVPLAKIKIIPAFQSATSYTQTLKSFRIVAEDGVKYDFEDIANSTVNVDLSIYPPGTGPTQSYMYGLPHATLWYLTRIISAFSTDTIKFNYESKNFYSSYKLPEITFVNNSNGSRKTPTSPIGNNSTGTKILTSIELPDKTTVSFIYSFATAYSANNFALSNIKISDTAFRFGYHLDYDSTYEHLDTSFSHVPHTLYDPIRLMLRSVTPYTKKEKQQGYEFGYYGMLPKFGSVNDTIQNARDYWGFYNGIDNNDSLIPHISPYSFGADRSTSNIWGKIGSLISYRLPTGGYIQYSYQINDHYPYTKVDTSISSIGLQSTTQNNIILNQVFNSMHQLTFVLDKSVSRTGSAPISGAGTLNVYIKNTSGTTTYLSTTISLYDFYYSGIKSWAFNLANGTYRLETSLAAGTSITGSFPTTVNWEIKRYDNTVNSNPGAGIRVNSILRIIDDFAEGAYEEYKYVTEDGKSSGFFGDIPRYDYPYRGVFSSGSTTIDYTTISSEPLGNIGFPTVGYSRVEIIKKGSAGSNLGKEVYEFTDLKDVNSNVFATSFPYTPQDFRGWGLGLPKKTLVYDSSGNLVKKTVNTIQLDTTTSYGNDFKSIKMGHTQSNYTGAWNSPGIPTSKVYIGEDYNLTSGRSYITSSFDTLYQPNGSINTSYQYLTYDTNYNVTNVRTSYDRNRSLEKETRIYYPYNYTIGGGIGKLRDSAIISQMVSTETWITDAGTPGNNRITGAAMTSFRSIGSGDIKPDTIYSFESNKPIVQATITSFDPAKLNRNTTYFKPQTYFVSYDSKSNLSEVKSLVTGLGNSVITDYDQQYAVAKVSNTVQADIAYTSFEAAGTGNWTVGSSTRDATQGLTGKKSYNVANGNITRSGLTSGKNYLLTLWVKTSSGTPTINGTGVSGSIASQNGWSFYSIPLTGITSITVSGSGTIDELRLHPKDANMETYSYEPLIGVTSGADANNTVVYTEYDNLNRVKLIRDKDKNIIKRFDYSDTTMSVSDTPLWVGFDKRCSPVYTAQVDSAYHDMNPLSDSAGYVKWVYQGYHDCSCVTGNPQWAVINGVCEQGTWTVVSKTYSSKTALWTCRQRWCFSDGSYSSYYVDITQPFECPITCFAI